VRHPSGFSCHVVFVTPYWLKTDLMTRPAAAIFDMDGVLIDSEPFWQRAQIEVFSRIGVHLTVEDTERTMGRRIRDVVAFWHAERAWRGPTIDAVAESVVHEVIRLVQTEGEPMGGSLQAIDLLQSLGIPLSLATSSDENLIEAVLSKLGLQSAFKVRCSAADEEFCKPHPAVYLTAARRLGVSPERCLVFEDSPAGVTSAKSAGMKVVALPNPAIVDHRELAAADLVIPGLEAFGLHTLQFLFDR
jgi:sugar-phosphatase